MVIQSFGSRETEAIFEGRRSRHLPPEIHVRARRRLRQLHNANSINDLRVPPSNRLERLSGDRSGQWSIRINQQWRVVFRWEDGNASDVQLIDYH